MAYEERETGNLIGSDKVEGTAVYGADNQRIGRTHDKRASTIETERAALEKRSEAEVARLGEAEREAGDRSTPGAGLAG